MPKDRNPSEAADKKSRSQPHRAVREKKNVEGLFKEASPVAPTREAKKKAKTAAKPGPRAARAKHPTGKDTSKAGHKFRWQFKDGEDGEWQDQHMQLSGLLETAYQDYIKNPGDENTHVWQGALLIEHHFNFHQLTQTNVEYRSNATLSIRRVPLEE